MRVPNRLFPFLLLTTLMLPVAPSSLRADDARFRMQAKVEKIDGHVCIGLSWTCSRDDVCSYEVEEKCEDGSGQNYHIVYLAPGGKSGQFVDADVNPHVYYDYRIRADLNDGTVSDYR
jgi:hypothetical protein